jgi:alpha-L-fucosidase 2
MTISNRSKNFLIILLSIYVCSSAQDKNESLSNSLWYGQPATDWLQALPVGNGRLGAMVFGDPEHERIQLNEDSMWPGGADWGNSKGNVKDLNHFRQLLRDGKPHEADAEYMNKFSYQTIVRSHQTMGDLYIDFKDDKKIENYKRSLSLDDALVSVSYTADGAKYFEKVFASKADDVLMVQLSTTAEKGMDLDLKLNRPEDHGHRTVTVSNPSNSEIGMKGMVTQYGGKKDSRPLEIDYGVRFETRLKVVNSTGTVEAKQGSLSLRGVKKVTLFIVCNTSFYTDDYEAKNTETLKSLKGTSFETLLKRHLEDYQELYSRVKLDLGGKSLDSLATDIRLEKLREGGEDRDLAAKLFQYGRYLLISSSRPGTNPANLQGLWNENIEAPWNADYHLNINLQMNYWPVEVTNISECNLPLFDFADRLLERGKITAKEQYGIDRGSVIHHASDLWAPAFMRAERPYWGAWIHGGGWLAQHYWERYAFTQDEVFLKERAYPFMKAVSEFYLDWLQKDEKSGKWISFPETSPENSYLASDGEPAALSIGAAMGHQIIAEVFGNVIKAAKILDIEDTFVKEVKSKIKNLYPGIIIGDDGRILEWSEPHPESEKGHRHMSHLYALYPGNAITSEEKDVLRAAQQTIDFRLENGAAGIGWSRAWMINFNARLLDAESAGSNILEFMKKSVADNLFVLINEGRPPFQMDANSGYTAGVAELLIQSHEGFIRLLPALPENWKTGSISGIIARGNVEVDMEWENGSLRKVGLLARQDCTVQLLHKSNEAKVGLIKNQKKWLNGELGPFTN